MQIPCKISYFVVYSHSVMLYMKQKLRGSLCLLCGTIIWGSAFIVQSVGMDYVGPFTFQVFRCLLAVIFLLGVIFILGRRRTDSSSYVQQWKNPLLWKTGLFCGIALFAASSLQQIGLMYTDAGKAGFITAMYIVLVPICSLFIKKIPPVSTVFSVGIATVGLYLLSCVGVTQVNIGDVYLTGGALCFAVQIILIGELGHELDGLQLNCVQNIVCLLLSIPCMFLIEAPQMDAVLSCWLPICYAGILSSGVAYSLQIIGQKDLPATAAALIMSLESVFAVLFGWLILHETLNATESAGCVLVFIAVILSQIPTKKRIKA